jgi:hypothetical protein
MSETIKITGRIIAAARALSGISQVEFAAAIGLPVSVLCTLEAAGSARIRSGQDVEAVKRGLENSV